MKVETESGRKHFTCIHCDKSYLRKFSLKRHLLTKHIKNCPFSCSHCGKPFSAWSNLQSHMTTHNADSQRLKSRTLPQQLESDAREKLVSVVNQIEEDGNVSNKTIGMKRVKTKLKNYSCKVCGRTFRYPSFLLLHTRKHTGERPYKCKTCGDCFKYPANLANHRAVHIAEQPYKCKKCRICFKSSESLKLHCIQMHTEEKLFECSVCREIFERSDSLRRHMLANHTNKRPYPCTECGKTFPSAYVLSRHIKVHVRARLLKIKAHNKDMNVNNSVSLSRLDEACSSQNRAFNTKEQPKKKTQYKCNVCGSVFECLSILRKHKLEHAGEKVFKCDKCDQAFDFRQHLYQHMKSHTEDQSLRRQAMPEQKEANVRQKSVRKIAVEENGNPSNAPLVSKVEKTKEGNVKCNVCGQTRSCRSALLVHMRKHTGERPYKCIKCGDTFRYSQNLTEHDITVHSGKGPDKCPFCDETFRWNQNLRRHILTRHNTLERLFPCTKCGKAFTFANLLRKHMKVHTSDGSSKSKSAKQINKQLVNESLSIIQLDNTCSSQGNDLQANKVKKLKQHNCLVCEKTFNSPSLLRKHMSEHPRHKLYRCKTCWSSFKHLTTFQLHCKMHKGEGKTNKCIHCSKVFIYPSSLLVHLKTHSKEKQFFCDYCGKRYQSLYTLKVHQQCHTGEKPYKCKECGECFNSSQSLKEHRSLTAHLQERPFKCNLCDESYVRRQSLGRHLLEKHSNHRPYSCELCEKAFVYPSDLRKHMKKHT